MNPLSELRPLHLPEPISWWPPAIGWWIAGILIVGLVILSIFLTIQHIKNNRYRKIALIELNALALTDTEDNTAYYQQINRLLKRIALQLWDREEIASLHSKAWFEFLNKQCKSPTFSEQTIDLLYRASYAKNAAFDQHANDQLFIETMNWIKKHKRPRTSLLKKSSDSRYINRRKIHE